jgi:hypothetical protein
MVKKPKETGRHATSKDTIMQAGLRRIIEELDDEVFNGTITLHQSAFGCNPHTS